MAQCRRLAPPPHPHGALQGAPTLPMPPRAALCSNYYEQEMLIITDAAEGHRLPPYCTSELKAVGVPSFMSPQGRSQASSRFCRRRWFSQLRFGFADLKHVARYTCIGHAAYHLPQGQRWPLAILSKPSMRAGGENSPATHAAEESESHDCRALKRFLATSPSCHRSPWITWKGLAGPHRYPGLHRTQHHAL